MKVKGEKHEEMGLDVTKLRKRTEVTEEEKR